MPERHSHNSRRRHSSLERLVSNRLRVHGGAQQSFAGLARRVGGEGMAGTLPHFPWAGTDKRVSLGVLFCNGQPTRWWRHALHVMDHTKQGIQEKDNPSSPHLQRQRRGDGGGGWLSPFQAQLCSLFHQGTAPELHVCQNPLSGSPPVLTLSQGTVRFWTSW